MIFRKRLLVYAVAFSPIFIGRSNADPLVTYDSKTITRDLELKASQLDSFAQDYIVMGKPVKRMWFLFKRNDKDFYMFRSDHLTDKKKKIHFSNLDGKYDCDYFPEENIAYRYPKKSEWTESNYGQAKSWHFDYKGAIVVGEEVLNGIDCFVLEKDEYVMTISKKTGLQTSLKSKGQPYALEYGNFEFDLEPPIFSIPPDVKIVDKQ